MQDIQKSTKHIWHVTKSSNVCVTEVSEGKGMKAELRISRTDKRHHPQIQKDLKTQSEINTKKTTRHKVKNLTLRLNKYFIKLSPTTNNGSKKTTDTERKQVQPKIIYITKYSLK